MDEKTDEICEEVSQVKVRLNFAFADWRRSENMRRKLAT